jgi:hypothetical protein
MPFISQPSHLILLSIGRAESVQEQEASFPVINTAFIPDINVDVPGEQTDDPNLDPVIFGRGPLTDVSSDASEEPNLKEADNADDADDADPTYDQIDSGGDTDYKPGRQKSGKGKGRGRGEASGRTGSPQGKKAGEKGRQNRHHSKREPDLPVIPIEHREKLKPIRSIEEETAGLKEISVKLYKANNGSPPVTYNFTGWKQSVSLQSFLHPGSYSLVSVTSRIWMLPS